MGNSVYTCLPAEKIADPIAELALDLRWTWNHSTDELWRALDPELWEATQNPWLVLQGVSKLDWTEFLRTRGFGTRWDLC